MHNNSLFQLFINEQTFTIERLKQKMEAFYEQDDKQISYGYGLQGIPVKFELTQGDNIQWVVEKPVEKP